MEAALGRVGQKAHATSGIMRKLGGAIGAYMGFSAVKGMADFATKMESTRLSMAVLLQSGDKLRGVMTPFGKAATEAGAAWDLIRQAAIQTPATTEQVAAGFNVIAMRARAAGMSLKDMVSLSANLATFDMMSGGKGVVQMDVEQLARGRPGRLQPDSLMSSSTSSRRSGVRVSTRKCSSASPRRLRWTRKRRRPSVRQCLVSCPHSRTR